MRAGPAYEVHSKRTLNERSFECLSCHSVYAQVGQQHDALTECDLRGNVLYCAIPWHQKIISSSYLLQIYMIISAKTSEKIDLHIIDYYIW